MPKSTLSRRELLKLSAGTLLSLGLWPGRQAFAITPVDTFKIAVLNDLHAMTPECGPWIEKIAADVKRRAPRFCVLAGDLTDRAEPEYMDLVHSIFKRIGCAIYAQIGNHDWITNSDRSTFTDRFPDSLNYTFNEGGWQFIALDTTEGQKGALTKIGSDTLRWLDAELPRLSKKVPTLVFTHFPLASDLRVTPINSEEILRRLLGYNLQAVFSGHFHGLTKHRHLQSMLYTNRCCSLVRPNVDGSKKKGYFMCELRAGRVAAEFISI